MESSQSNQSLNVDQKRINDFMDAAGHTNSECKVLRMLRETPELINAQDECGDTALMKASSAGRLSIVQHLVAKGADIKARRADGSTPLMWASRNGHSSIVKCLLDNGAAVNAEDKNGETALMGASGKGHVSISRLLLKHEAADINAKNKDGWTALMMASSEGHDANVELLLDKWADESTNNENGKTALDLAKNDDVRRLLEEAPQRRSRSGAALCVETGAALTGYPTPSIAHKIKSCDVKISFFLSSSIFSTVYRGKYKNTDVAIKMLHGDGGDLQMREIEMLSNLRHPRIVSLLGVITDLEDRYGAAVGLVTEFMSRGCLYDVLHLDKTPPQHRLRTLSSKLRVLNDVADGMQFLHMSNVIHGDLKPSNILQDGDGRIKIGDFGDSRLLGTNATHATAGGAGTPAWQAPEALLGNAVRQSCDVYSFGVILWEMLTNSIPWKGVYPFLISVKISQGESLPLDAAASVPFTPPELLNLLEASLNMNADNRPTFDTILLCLSELLPACIAREGRVHCPDAYMCPVSYEIMEDPVICSDGQTYDRVNIERWFQQHNTSPLTNAILVDRTLRPNIALRGMIQEFKSAECNNP